MFTYGVYLASEIEIVYSYSTGISFTTWSLILHTCFGVLKVSKLIQTRSNYVTIFKMLIKDVPYSIIRLYLNSINIEIIKDSYISLLLGLFLYISFKAPVIKWIYDGLEKLLISINVLRECYLVRYYGKYIHNTKSLLQTSLISSNAFMDEFQDHEVSFLRTTKPLCCGNSLEQLQKIRDLNVGLCLSISRLEIIYNEWKNHVHNNTIHETKERKFKGMVKVNNGLKTLQKTLYKEAKILKHHMKMMREIHGGEAGKKRNSSPVSVDCAVRDVEAETYKYDISISSSPADIRSQSILLSEALNSQGIKYEDFMIQYEKTKNKFSTLSKSGGFLPAFEVEIGELINAIDSEKNILKDSSEMFITAQLLCLAIQEDKLQLLRIMRSCHEISQL